MKNLLIVSFYFPPIMSAGSVRMGKFAKYLPEFGWNPIVLTVQPKDILAKGIPVEMEDRRIIRTPYHDPVGLFSKPPGAPVKSRNPGLGEGKKGKKTVREWLKDHSPFTIQRLPDRMLFWYPYAIKEGRKLIFRKTIDAIFSSHPVPTSHLIASKLARTANLPWVADYRDLWTGSTLRPYPKWLESLERRIEKRVLRKANVLTTVSEPLRNYLGELHQKPVKVIYNGFDPADYVAEPIKADPGVFTLIYSGTLYTDRQSPVSFFEALREMLGEGIVSKDTFRVRFIGVQEPPFQDLVAAYGLESVVVSEPFQPYKENIATLKGADALLFFSWDEGKMKGNLTSKIFQYIGAERPILVVGKGNQFVADFVKSARTGAVGEDKKRIREILSRWLGEFQKNGSVTCVPSKEAIDPYNRKTQSKQLATILDGLTP